MSKTLEQLQQELDAPIPRSAVSQRSGGGGKSLSYLQGHYVIDRLNKTFGPLGWATDIKSLEKLFEGKVDDKYYVSYGATVRLVVQGPDGKATEHTDVGYGDGSDRHPGKPYELARKEAITDALKRCAKNLGQSMGLALYDKDQPNVVDDEALPDPKGKPAPAAAPAAAASERPSAKGAHADRPQGAPTNRETLNKNIASIAKIALAKGKATQAELEAELKKYGASKKEDLSDESAQKLFDSLKQLVG